MGPSPDILNALAAKNTVWNWNVKTSLLWPPQSRERTIYLFALGHIPPCSQLAPLYILDVYPPQTIQECLPNEDRSSCFLEGGIRINYISPSRFLEPPPFGFIQLSRTQINRGNKVHFHKGKSGVVTRPLGGNWFVFSDPKESGLSEKELKICAANYHVYSVSGVSFPVGK